MEKPEAWANLGQGAPEVDDEIQGCFERPHEVDITLHGREYGPTAGIKPLREAVATLYNEYHRKWRNSKYTWENVCIVPGGRAGLIRIAAVLGNAYLGFFIPGGFFKVLRDIILNFWQTILHTMRCCRFSVM